MSLSSSFVAVVVIQPLLCDCFSFEPSRDRSEERDESAGAGRFYYLASNDTPRQRERGTKRVRVLGWGNFPIKFAEEGIRRRRPPLLD